MIRYYIGNLYIKHNDHFFYSNVCVVYPIVNNSYLHHLVQLLRTNAFFIMNRSTVIGIGIVLTTIVFYSMFLWLNITSDSTGSFEDDQLEYLRHYPAIIRNARLLTVFHILLNVCAVTCFIKVRGNSRKASKWLGFLIILNITMLIWQLFSLM